MGLLTVKGIERLRNQPGRYADGDGLYLQIRTPKNASWLFRYEVADQRPGKRTQRWMGLGPLRYVPVIKGLKDQKPLSLADLDEKNLTEDDTELTGRERPNLLEARLRAARASELVAAGIDPLDEKRKQRQQDAIKKARELTFEQAAHAYYEGRAAKWKNAKHSAQFLSTLKTYAFPIIGSLPVADIDTPLVLKCIEPHWTTKTETMSRVRGRIEKVLGWATVRHYRKGDNPARWNGHLVEALVAPGDIAKPKHHPALPFTELPLFMVELAKREGIGARALEFTILTAARTGEVIGATWDEFDLKAKTWTIPAGRMKAKKQHRVPLSDAAVDLLKALPTEKGNPHVFVGPRKGSSLSNMGMAVVLKRMERTNITVHGFRSTFRDWAAEQTTFENNVVEMALAHTVRNKVEAAYRRGDLLEKRKPLMALWAQFAMTPVPVDNVTQLRRAK